MTNIMFTKNQTVSDCSELINIPIKQQYAYEHHIQCQRVDFMQKLNLENQPADEQNALN